MSDAFYRFVRFAGKPIFRLTARPVIIGLENIPALSPANPTSGPAGSCLIASTHESPYDIVILIAHTPRLIDFISIVEIFRNPLFAWFYGSLNAFPLDRSRPDAGAVRTILTRLGAGRVVTMFPEGRLRSGPDSVIHTRKIRPGIGRISMLSQASIIPCVIINSSVYRRPLSWLPLFRTRYGVIYGQPLRPDTFNDRPADMEQALVDSLLSLHAHLSAAMKQAHGTAPTPTSDARDS